MSHSVFELEDTVNEMSLSQLGRIQGRGEEHKARRFFSLPSKESNPGYIMTKYELIPHLF